MALAQRLTDSSQRHSGGFNITINTHNTDSGQRSDDGLANEPLDTTDDDDIKSSLFVSRVHSALIFLGIKQGKFKYACAYKWCIKIWICYICFVDTVVKVFLLLHKCFM
jgi:hypothetical protein